MKQSMFALSILLLLFTATACNDGAEYANTPEENFEALWKIIDENYCFFEYKQVDWAAIHDKYKARLSGNTTEEGLFNLFGEMLAELKDGHTNLYSAFNMARYWKWFEDYPSNFNADVQRAYLQSDYLISGALRYKILDDNIGYIYYGSFSSPIGEGNMDQVIYRLQACDGIIIDVRNNGGGNLTNVDIIASRFINERVLTGYITHKTGKGHNDFSEPFPKYLEPSPRHRYQKHVAVLVNRSSYSATNDFIGVMKQLSNVTLVGDKSGGGSGLPFSSELPNGWSVRFSASPMLDPQKQHIEYGIEPHEKVDMKPSDVAKNIDTIIERARTILKTNRGNG